MTTIQQLEEKRQGYLTRAAELKHQEWEIKTLKSHNEKEMRLNESLLSTLKQAEIDKQMDGESKITE